MASPLWWAVVWCRVVVWCRKRRRRGAWEEPGEHGERLELLQKYTPASCSDTMAPFAFQQLDNNRRTILQKIPSSWMVLPDSDSALQPPVPPPS